MLFRSPRKPANIQEEALATVAARQARQAMLGSKPEEVQQFVTASVEAHRAGAPPAASGAGDIIASMHASINAAMGARRADMGEESVYSAAGQDDDGWYSQS